MSETAVVHLGFDTSYVISWRGILKITECSLDIAGFICAIVWIHWSQEGGGWVQFVTISAFVTTLALFILHLFRIIRKLPPRLPWTLIQMFYHGLYSLMMLIAGIVSAGLAYHTNIILTAIFTFLATPLYVLDTVLLYRDWRKAAKTAATLETPLPAAENWDDEEEEDEAEEDPKNLGWLSEKRRKSEKYPSTQPIF